MNSQSLFSAAFSFPLSEHVWSLESVGAAGRAVFGCVGVSVPSSLWFLCDVVTASHSADACSLGTWQQEEQTVMA